MEFNGTGSRPLALIDAVRHIFLTDIRLIGRIIDNDTSVLIGIIHPLLQSVLCDGGTCRIIGKTQIDQIRYGSGKLRNKPVLCRTGHIDHIGPFPGCRIKYSRPSCHDIGIHIHRVDRVTYSNTIVQSKNLLNISRITFCSIGDKNFIRFNLTAPCSVIIRDNRISQKIITQIRCVTSKGLLVSHFLHSLLQCIRHNRGKRKRHISDSQTDNLFIRI